MVIKGYRYKHKSASINEKTMKTLLSALMDVAMILLVILALYSIIPSLALFFYYGHTWYGFLYLIPVALIDYFIIKYAIRYFFPKKNTNK